MSLGDTCVRDGRRFVVEEAQVRCGGASALWSQYSGQPEGASGLEKLGWRCVRTLDGGERLAGEERLGLCERLEDGKGAFSVYDPG
jgi:hypothetical protein